MQTCNQLEPKLIPLWGHFFLKEAPLLDNPGFQLFCSECILTRPLLLKDVTRFLLRSMLISGTATTPISLRHKRSTEPAVLLVSSHIWHPILTGSSLHAQIQLLGITVHPLILGKMPAGMWDAAVQPWTMQLLQSSTEMFFFQSSKQVFRLFLFS